MNVIRNQFTALAIAFATLNLMSVGCGSTAATPEWEIAAVNRGDIAVDVAVTHGIKSGNGSSNGSAYVNNLSQGKTHSLLVGPDKTIVETVKVTRNGVTQELAPEVEITIRQKYLIVIDKDGKANGSVVSR